MNRLGAWSASALCVIGVAYVVTLAVGFTSAGFAKPIVDPVLAVMEILTLLSAPILVVLMAAVHAYAPPEYKTGLAFDGIRARVAGVGPVLGPFAAPRGTRI